VRYGLIAAAAILAIVAAALAAGVGPARPTDFEGTWQSTDPGDGSRQTLVIGGGTRPALHFEDDFATGAACANSDVKVFTMDGTGSIDGDRLDVAWPDGGGCGPLTIDIGPGSYFYDQGTDTITDRQGLTWTHLERVPVPPSSTPTLEPTLPSPTADPDCIDFDSPRHLHRSCRLAVAHGQRAEVSGLALARASRPIRPDAGVVRGRTGRPRLDPRR
jgi:hypothetical protein